MEEIRLFFETTAYIFNVITLGVIVWYLRKSLTSFQDGLKKALLDVQKKQQSDYIKALKEQRLGGATEQDNLDQLAEPIRSLQDVTQKLDNLHSISNTHAKYDGLVATYNGLCAQYIGIEDEVSRVKAEKDNLESDQSRVKAELTEVTIKNQDLVRRLDDAKLQISGYMACLPIEKVDRIYRELEKQCSGMSGSPLSIQYIYSRLAVIVAIGNLEMDADEKQIMLRDAFSDFDKAVYARFMYNKELLRALRSFFEHELMPILEGTLKFRWPNTGDALNLEEHRQEQENGLGIITEVKTAILYTGSGALMQKAVVRT
jgi:hypothetical protein